MEPLGQPLGQTRLGRGQIHAGHANLGKSRLSGPLADPGQQLMRIDLSTVERHPPIVGTPSKPSASVRLVWRTEAETGRFARRLAASQAVRNAFIELHGDLGAGKTTLVRHLLRALGVNGRIKSPTYAVVEPHEVPGLAIWHFDFFRFNDPREWEDAGFRDLFASPGLKLAEWPEKAAGMLPVADLVLRIESQPDESRVVTCSTPTTVGQALLKDASR